MTTQLTSTAPTNLKRNLFLPAVMAFLGGIAFSLNFEVQDIASLGQGYWGDFFYQFITAVRFSLQGAVPQSTLFFIAFFLLFRFTAKHQARRNLFSVLVCIGIAFFWVAGKAFSINDNWGLLMETPAQIAKTFLFWGFSSYLLDQLYLLFIMVIEKKNQKRLLTFNAPKLYQRNPFWFSFGVILLMWLPYIIACYPAIFCNDAYVEVLMAQGFLEFSSHHTVAHPLLLGWFVRLGQIIGNANIGLFAFVLFQVFCFAGFLSYTQVFMRNLKTPRWFRLVCFIIYGFVSYFAHYSTVILKDNLYSYGVALLILELIFMIERKEKYWTSAKHIVLFVLASIFTVSFRKNGVYLFYPLAGFLLIFWAITSIKKHSLKPIINVCFALLLPILLVNLFNVTMTNRYQISDSGIREMLSLPLQQTARYVKEHPEEITAQEKAVINQVLPYDELGNLYRPLISDPVKGALRASSLAEMKDYFVVWTKQFARRPILYLKATMNQNYVLLYPFSYSSGPIYASLSLDREADLKEKLTIERSSFGVICIETLRSYFLTLSNLPIIGLLNNLAVWNILLLFTLVYSLSKRYWNLFWIFLPLLISVAFVILAPYAPPRYCFPIIYSMPVVIAYLHYRAKLTQ